MGKRTTPWDATPRKSASIRLLAIAMACSRRHPKPDKNLGTEMVERLGGDYYVSIRFLHGRIHKPPILPRKSRLRQSLNTRIDRK